MPDYPRVGAVVSVGDWFFDDEALPDTGFTGGVIIPNHYINEVPIAPQFGTLVLGNGQVVDALFWEGEFSVGELDVSTTVWALGNDFILGREVLDQLEICFVFGREVRLRFAE